MLWVPLNMGMSAAHCQGNVREFQSVWRVVTLYVDTHIQGGTQKAEMLRVDIYSVDIYFIIVLDMISLDHSSEVRTVRSCRFEHFFQMIMISKN